MSTETEELRQKAIEAVKPVMESDSDKFVSITQAIKGNHKPPSKWVIRHKGPYFREKYAKKFKEVLDNMMITLQPCIYRYKDFPELKRPRSLYLKIYQSKSYLLQFMDPDGRYKTFLESVNIETVRGVGILMELLEHPSGVDNFANPSPVSNDPESWKEKLDAYLEADKVDAPFEERDLMLTEEEANELRIQLDQLSNVVCHITQDRIKVVRTDMIRH